MLEGFPIQDDRWSVIPMVESLEVLESLSNHCHSPEALEANNYRTRPYNSEDLAGIRRCKNCGRLERAVQGRDCVFHPEQRRIKNQVQFLCCGDPTRPCKRLSTHEYQDLKPQVIGNYQSFQHTPQRSLHNSAFRAVTLDCEMVGVEGSYDEVIFICAADFVTGAILLNRYVCPKERITDWRSWIHGVTPSAMQAAVLQGTALNGWQEARDELWKIIDSDTILVGHALNNDLNVLRILHSRVVDSAILTKQAVGLSHSWGLKALCSELLHVPFRANETGAHYCSEDVLATREVVLLCLRNKQKLENWAKVKKWDDLRREEERKEARKAKKAEDAKKAKEILERTRAETAVAQEGNEVKEVQDVGEVEELKEATQRD